VIGGGPGRTRKPGAGLPAPQAGRCGRVTRGPSISYMEGPRRIVPDIDSLPGCDTPEPGGRRHQVYVTRCTPDRHAGLGLGHLGGRPRTGLPRCGRRRAGRPPTERRRAGRPRAGRPPTERRSGRRQAGRRPGGAGRRRRPASATTAPARPSAPASRNAPLSPAAGRVRQLEISPVLSRIEQAGSLMDGLRLATPACRDGGGRRERGGRARRPDGAAHDPGQYGAPADKYRPR
jgi:hypothetical protein